MSSPILVNIKIDQRRLNEVIRMASTKERRITDVLMNPKSGADLATCALYAQSPYNQMLTECIIARYEVAQICEEFIIARDMANAKDEVSRELMMQRMLDKDAARQLAHAENERHHHENRVTKDPEVRPSLFELQAKAELLSVQLTTMKAKLVPTQTAISELKQKLSTINQNWQTTQAASAAQFILNLPAQMANANVGLDIPLTPSDVKRLDQAFITASPAKILAVNPDFANSSAANVDLMANVSNFVRELRVLSALSYMMGNNKEAIDEDVYFPKPSDMKILSNIVKVPVHTDRDREIIKNALETKLELTSLQKDLREQISAINSIEKLLNKTNDEILSAENTATNRPNSPSR